MRLTANTHWFPRQKFTIEQHRIAIVFATSTGRCASPFLLLHHINSGLALACTTLLVYSPFAQRSLVHMGAGSADRNASATVR